MIRMTLTMLSNQIVWRDFDTQEEAEQYIAEVSSKGNWGSPQQIINHPEVLEQLAVDAVPAVLDAEGNIITEEIPALPYIAPQAASTEIIAGFTVAYEDITEQLAKEKELNDLKAMGAAARAACNRVMDLVGGYNYSRNLTTEQITEMSTLFAPIVQCLMVSRPSTAKALISAITPDEVLITTQMKADILNELTEF